MTMQMVGKTYRLVIVDVFRLENGRIVEHWDVVQDLVPTESTASGRPMA